MAHDVFLSHSTQDKVVADAVCAALEAEKIRCWIAPRDIKSGENWAEAITRALKSSRLMVLIFSDHSNQSKQVANELTLAVGAKAVVVPFKIEDIPPNQVMEYYLTGAHWLDAMNPPTESQISHLVELVKKTLDGEPGVYVQTEKSMGKTPTGTGFRKTRNALSALKKVGLAAVALIFGGLLVYGVNSYSTQIGLREGAAEEGKTGNGAFIPPEIGTIVVTKTEDDGLEGSLRRALLKAVQGDVITFDPTVFPPDDPQTIYIKSSLPQINMGNLTINGSNSGVIINGIQKESNNLSYGLCITSSNNIIMGLQIINCRGFGSYSSDQGIGIMLQGPGANNNLIGGDRSVGVGPIGQGNLFSNNNIGIDIQGGARNNIITGNLFGTDINGNSKHDSGSNTHGIVLDQKAANNIIGPDNIIAYNTYAVIIGTFHQPDGYTINNTITNNSIYSNFHGITINSVANKNIKPPRIASFNLSDGIVRGTAIPGSIIEIFSDKADQGRIFEGRVQADESGNFTFEAGRGLTGPNITATTTDEDGNTSEFSSPVGN